MNGMRGLPFASKPTKSTFFGAGNIGIMTDSLMYSIAQHLQAMWSGIVILLQNGVLVDLLVDGPYITTAHYAINSEHT